MAISIASIEGGLRRSEAVLGVLEAQVRSVSAGKLHAEAQRERSRKGFGETLKAHDVEIGALRREMRMRNEENESLLATIRSLETALERGVEARCELESTIR